MDTINDNLSLTVINDGDGSQCGYSYKVRCSCFVAVASEESKAKASLRMVACVDRWMQRRGYQGASAFELLDQAAKVAEYYAEHMADQYAPHDTGAA